MRKNASARKRRKSNKLSMFLVGFVMFIFCGIMVVQIIDAKEQKVALEKQEQVLNKKLSEEKQRTEELKERKIYVQTKQYIEEAAGKLGYIYPDQVILKPEEK